MKFFSRDLYARLNSSREEEVDEATARWEEAVSGYEAYLETVREEMPSHVRTLTDTYHHDAEFVPYRRMCSPLARRRRSLSLTGWRTPSCS